jgi:hypothetical protein
MEMIVYVCGGVKRENLGRTVAGVRRVEGGI